MKYRVLRRGSKVIIAGETVHYAGGNLARAWEEAFCGLGLEDRKWNSVLLIGMGASLIQLLSRHPSPPGHIAVIEIDPVMVRLQEAHFTLPLPYHVHIGDAAEVVHTLSGMYDGIFIDAFVEDFVPENLLSETFVSALGGRLQTTGLLVWNALRPGQSGDIGRLLSGTFTQVRKWKYAPHTFWIAGHRADAFPTPF